MYFNLHRFFSPKTPTTTEPKSEPFSFSSLRSRLSLTFSQKKKQQQQKPKAVHWGSITIIQDTEDEPEPESKLQPESEPCNHNAKQTSHNRRPILKPATPLDITTSHASLWELIHETESRIRLNYEYLHITSDAALDAWFRKEEEAMFRQANAVARANLDRHASDGFVSVPLTRQDNGEDWEFVADVGGGSEGRAAKPRRALRCLRVSVPRAPVLRVRF